MRLRGFVKKNMYLKFIYKLHIIIIACALALGCKNELELLAPKKEIPIAYGLLDLNDSLQVLRLERAFLVNNDPELVVTTPDSIYYQDAQIFLNSIPLRHSSELSVFIPRDEGLFVQDPNTYYFLSSDDIELTPGEEYMMTIQLEDEILALSQTKLVPEFSIFAPQPDGLIDFNRQEVNFRWASEELIHVYDIQIEIKIEEELNGQRTQRNLTWELSNGYENTRLVVSGDEFYKFLQGALEIVPGINRSISELIFYITGGGLEYAEFIRINQQNQGITGFTSVNSYTNISGGIGLFSSRYTHPGISFNLTESTIQSLNEREETRSLGFR